MSTTALPGDFSDQDHSSSVPSAVSDMLTRGVAILASMKLTCILFLLGMFVVFVGSLAQARRDVWLVIDEYFRVYWAWVDVADFFPPSMFPGLVGFDWDSLGLLRWIPFPGGWTIGWIMLANLLAAHMLRFRILAVGGRLTAGISTLVIGALLTYGVIRTGNQQTGVDSANTLLSPLQIWYLMLTLLAVSAAIPIATALIRKSVSRPERLLNGAIGVTLGAVLMYFVFGGEDARLNLSSMRILWQLLKGTACAVVLLMGCRLLFDKRGGIVLLHIGVALLMISELQVGFNAEENMLGLAEGQSSRYITDRRERELAVITRQDDGKEKVITIPESMLTNAAQSESDTGRIIDAASLPFRIRVDRLIRNSRLRSRLPGEEKLATTGLGTFVTPIELDPVNGMNNSHDSSTLQIALLDRDGDQQIQQLLLNQDVSEMRTVPIAEQADVNGVTYSFYLRSQRNYRDWEAKLIDVSRTNYIGTSTPKDYRSRIVLTDRETGEENEFTVWMNNPLRYKGETFYQTSYYQAPDGTEMTSLSVVRNSGWMLPYIACMIVAVGMFAQFGQTLSRYLARFERG
ncbi:MAG: cytochrome c biogenesis protein ResB, partial [Planctomycetaceae bacterium]|nr:cytochrome c biogenesis protein ResB [Planctomycetaceae bacterium]